MDRRELTKRYALFLFSVLVNAFSIAFITRGMLGLSPISTVPYVLSLIAPLTMGQFTILMNFVFILLEVILMKRAEVFAKKYELLSQIPVTILFGSFIDVSVSILWWLEPTLFIGKFATLIMGCFILAFGISLAVKADVSMVTGEYLVRIISRTTKCEFGWVKLGFDISLVLISTILSLVFLSSFEGVGIGTIAGALMVGPVTHFLVPRLSFLDSLLHVDSSVAIPEAKSSLPLIITITHEFGSRGRQLGKMLSDSLGIKCYDKKLISMVAADSKLPEKLVSEKEQSKQALSLLDLVLCDYVTPLEESLSKEDRIFVSQSRVIRRIALRESCIIVGRCSDFILKDRPKDSIISVFCYTDLASAVKRVVEEYHKPREGAEEEVSKVNRYRISHYQHFTGRRWGDSANYALMLNTSQVPLALACEIIGRMYRQKSESLKPAKSR